MTTQSHGTPDAERRKFLTRILRTGVYVPPMIAAVSMKNVAVAQASALGGNQGQGNSGQANQGNANSGQANSGQTNTGNSNAGNANANSGQGNSGNNN